MNLHHCQCSVSDLQSRLYGVGACAAGAVRCAPVPNSVQQSLKSWISRGCHGTMDYLERNVALASDPTTLLPCCQTVICAAFPYAPISDKDRSTLFADYARGADYHKVLRKRLKPIARYLEELVPGSRTRICVDSAPMREKWWAVGAGLGHIGLNSLLHIPGVGSKVFLAEILWTEPVEGASEPLSGLPQPECTNCGICVQSCPMGVLDGLGGLDASRCLSYLTIEHKGDFPKGLSLNERIYGCDICQDVCPENKSGTPLPEFCLQPSIASLDAVKIANLSEEEYSSIVDGSAVRRVSLSQLLRNLSCSKATERNKD